MNAKRTKGRPPRSPTGRVAEYEKGDDFPMDGLYAGKSKTPDPVCRKEVDPPSMRVFSRYRVGLAENKNPEY